MRGPRTSSEDWSCRLAEYSGALFQEVSQSVLFLSVSVSAVFWHLEGY